ncbi:MAG: hypothetical protein ABSC51_02370 [Gaiellaceae bacterium]
MAVRAPYLYHSLRLFCLGAFSELECQISGGAEIPFAFEEHASPGRPSLYEYRPLVRGFLEQQAQRLMMLADAQAAIDDLRHERAAAIFARAHAGEQLPDEEALFMTVLLPVLVATAEGCGGFDWHDDAFDCAYIELEQSLFGSERTYAAVAPLLGLSLGAQVDLGDGIRVRVSPPGEISTYWPEASGILPREFGRKPDRLAVIELQRALAVDQIDAPDAPSELADAVSALRLATAGAIAAGPVLFERLDRRPYGIRPILPIAATQPYGEATRLDQFRGKLAHDLRARITLADDDRELAEALDRWELSLFAQEPFRSDQLREALVSLLGSGEGLAMAALRAATLLGEGSSERADLRVRLRALAGGEPADQSTGDAIRRALVEVLMHGNRARMIEALDESLLGLRPRPNRSLAVRAAAG